ncbi:hypothetical protein SESBI_33781 [Sesbania bispinosa]|nr:hypothetical protein SESBI_33781 [Sesbania bispinosa]
MDVETRQNVFQNGPIVGFSHRGCVHVDVGLFQGVGNNIGYGPLAFGLGVDNELMENEIRLADQIHVASKRADEVVLVENEASGPGLACDLLSCRMEALHIVAVGEAIHLEGEISDSSLQESVSQIRVSVECDTFNERDGMSVSAYFVALGASYDLSGEARLCEVPIAIVEDFDVTCGIRSETTSAAIKGGNIKRRRGRPRKQSFKLKMGLDLGVSGYDDESIMINRLADMEKRDQLAIGRELGL